MERSITKDHAITTSPRDLQEENSKRIVQVNGEGWSRGTAHAIHTAGRINNDATTDDDRRAPPSSYPAGSTLQRKQDVNGTTWEKSEMIQ